MNNEIALCVPFFFIHLSNLYIFCLSVSGLVEHDGHYGQVFSGFVTGFRSHILQVEATAPEGPVSRFWLSFSVCNRRHSRRTGWFHASCPARRSPPCVFPILRPFLNACLVSIFFYVVSCPVPSVSSLGASVGLLLVFFILFCPSVIPALSYVNLPRFPGSYF